VSGIMVMQRVSMFFLLVLVLAISFTFPSNISLAIGYIKASFMIKYIDMINLGFICF